MAEKPISKKIEKRVRKGAKAVEKSVKKLRPDTGPSTAKIAGAAAAGVAGIAGIAAAVRYLRRNSEGRATFHVIAKDSDWLVMADGNHDALDTFRTKEEAVDAAREAAAKVAPSELVIHRLDGSVMRSHSYDSE